MPDSRSTGVPHNLGRQCCGGARAGGGKADLEITTKGHRVRLLLRLGPEQFWSSEGAQGERSGQSSVSSSYKRALGQRVAKGCSVTHLPSAPGAKDES